MSTEFAATPSLTIRPLTVADGAAFAALLGRLSFAAQFTRFGRLIVGQAATLYAMQALQRPGIALGTFEYGRLVAVAEGAAAGPMGDWDRPGTLDVALVVAPEREGRGLGFTLVSAIAERAAATGYNALALAFAPDNERMVRIATRVSRDGLPGQPQSQNTEMSLHVQPGMPTMQAVLLVPIKSAR